ncbi:MAG TPA: glycosyltransferase family 39 protein [Elusimicrobiales bacterium]|nr:glycosyltransferase family 39 protein [Elusimicrobiales bacterium]
MTRRLTIITFSGVFKALLPLLLSAIYCSIILPRAWEHFADPSFGDRLAAGSFLLSGFPAGHVTFDMPFFATATSALLNAGVGPMAAAVPLHFLLCLLVFRAGSMAGGYRAGTAALAALAGLEFLGAGRWTYDIEQAVYSFFLLLVLCALLAARRGRLRDSLAAGLAVGMSVLTRPPLFFFPPLLLAVELIARPERRGRFAARAAVFLAFSYVLLLPWGSLNRWLTGEFSLVNRVSAADNVISGALGAVYTMEGDSRELAGLSPDEGAENFFFRTVAADPVAYALVLVRRLWHIFLFNPLLFGGFAAVLLFRMRRGLVPAFSLPAYFVLVHAAFSVDSRYFYPMVYIMTPLISGALFNRLRPAEKEAPGPGPGVYIAGLTALAAVLAVEALVIAYPYRAAAAARDPIASAARFPRDRALRGAACGLTLEKSGHAAFISCLEAYSLDFPVDGVDCSLSAVKMARPSRAALPDRNEAKLYCLAARLLRGLELGEGAYADDVYRQAMTLYQECCAMLRGEPYSRDRELAAAIRRQTGRFWERYVVGALSLWPPDRRKKLVPAISNSPFAPPDLSIVSSGPQWAFSVPVFNPAAWAASSSAGHGAKWAEVTEERSALSKKISDAAVDDLRAGRVQAAEAGLKRALNADPLSPEALATLCFVQDSAGRVLEAAETCGLAFCSVYLNPARQRPGRRELAAGAADRRHALLLQAGRKKEADRFLYAYSYALPVDWPRPAGGGGTGGGPPVSLSDFLNPGDPNDPCYGLRVHDAVEDGS